MEKEIILNRNIFDESVKKIAKKDVILDICGYSPFHGKLLKYKNLFDKAKYYCVDIVKNGNPDVMADAQELPFKNESIDGIICYAGLEHVLDPHKAVKEIYRVLKIKGEAFFYVPFLYPYHAETWFKDYHRFTKDLILYMFKDFDKVTIQPGENFADTSLRFVVAFSHYYKYVKFLGKIQELLFKRISRHDGVKNTTEFHVYARK